MHNYDDLLREQEQNEKADNTLLPLQWDAMQKMLDKQLPTNSNGKPTKPTKWTKLFLSSTVIALVSLVGLYLFNKKKHNNTDDNTLVTKQQSALQPPLSTVTIPYESYSYIAEVGDTFFTQTGSIIIFPKNAVLNSNGELVKGKVDILLREFNDPLAYSLSGIPMDYDSAGVKYNFVSSGMIDIKAYQNDALLQVNPNAKPQLNLLSSNENRNTNIYRMDTITGKWLPKGREEVNNLLKSRPIDIFPKKIKMAQYDKPVLIDRISKTNTSYEIEGIDLSKDEDITQTILPIKPEIASGKNTIIEILIDPDSFEELKLYHNLKFEVIGNKVEELSEASKTIWENVVLEKSNGNGMYTAKFSTSKETVTYTVKPVLEGKDFVAAQKIYEEQLAAYNEQITKRLLKDAAEKENVEFQKDEAVKDQKIAAVKREEIIVENKRIEELNKLIIIRNAYIEQENKRILTLNEENKRRRDSAMKAYEIAIATQNKINDSLQKVAETNRLKWEQELQRQRDIYEQNNRTLALNENLIRSFEIDQFGIWNCDEPTLPGTESIQYVGIFRDKEDKNINYFKLTMVAEGINRLMVFYNKEVDIIKNKMHYGWAFNDNQFYYFTTNDFAVAQKMPSSNTIQITMQAYAGIPNNYGELKRLFTNNKK